MKINIEKISDGFTCFGCGQDHFKLAIEATKEAGEQVCYDCAFASLRSQILMDSVCHFFYMSLPLSVCLRLCLN